MDPSFSLLDALVFPDDPSTPTSPTFFNPFNNASSSSLDPSSTASSSSQLDYSNLHDPWEGFPAGDYADYDPVSYGGGGMMGLDLAGGGGGAGMGGASNGVELMDIAPLPALIHSLPLNHSYHTSNTPSSYCPSNSYNDYAHASTSDEQNADPSPSPSSHYSSLPRTPPSLILHTSSSSINNSSSSSSNKRARRESSVNPYASTTAGSSYDGSPEPESLRVLGEDDEQDFINIDNSKKGGAGAGAGAGGAPTGKGKKRKQLPTTAEFQHPDVSGLSKKEARLVKNRAAAFLSRQRKREQFDELEIQCNALVAENNQLKTLLAAKASSSSSSSSTPAPAPPAKVNKRQAAAAAAAAAAAQAQAAQVDQAQVQSLQSDLANLRTLLHASTAREAALEVEMASLRAQLGGGPAGGKGRKTGGGSLSPMLSGGLIQEAEEAVAGGGAGAGGQAEEAGVTAGGRRGTVGRRERDREGKRVGGVALMVILFSFALFTLPPGTISNLPLRSSGSPTTSSFPFSSLGRVLQPGGPGAGFPTAIERQVLNKDDSTTSSSEDDVDVEMGVCEMEESSHRNGTDSTSRKEECLAEEKEKRRSNEPATDAASSIPKDLSHWNYPSSSSVSNSLDLASSDSRRSFSLTLLRPIPSSPASLHLTPTTDGVEDVLERWLGLSLFDQASSGPSPVGGGGASNSNAHDDEPGWFVVDSSASSPFTSFVPQEDEQEPTVASGGGVEETKAWDGTPLERMELDEVVLGLSSSSSSSPSPLSSPSQADNNNKLPSPSPRIPHSHSYLSLPPNNEERANETSFVRLDLELEVGVRRREVAIVGREEVGRMMLKGGGGSGGGGLVPGGWIN